jgi:hypothetical protein
MGSGWVPIPALMEENLYFPSKKYFLQLAAFQADFSSGL